MPNKQILKHKKNSLEKYLLEAALPLEKFTDERVFGNIRQHVRGQQTTGISWCEAKEAIALMWQMSYRLWCDKCGLTLTQIEGKAVHSFTIFDKNAICTKTQEWLKLSCFDIRTQTGPTIRVYFTTKWKMSVIYGLIQLQALGGHYAERNSFSETVFSNVKHEQNNLSNRFEKHSAINIAANVENKIFLKQS